MPRNNKNTRRQWYAPLPFKDICRLAGITPKQRLVVSRYLKHNQIKII